MAMGGIRALVCINIILIVTNLSAQPLANISTYLDNPGIPKAAKLFYEGKIKASDDSITFSIIDSLSTKNGSTRPFYILLVTRMNEIADGGLAEIVFPACTHFFEKNPNELIEFLYAKNGTVKYYFRTDWAYTIANWMQEVHDGNEKRYLIKLKADMQRITKPKNMNDLEDFYTILYKQYIK